MNELITVTRLPEIKEELLSLKEKWQKKAEDAASLVCTEETVQSLKEIRAEMRKEFDDADKQRKFAKCQYMAPWEEVEAAFKAFIRDSFVAADDALKTQIGNYEGTLKQECYKRLEDFFLELVAMEGIGFLSFEQCLKMGNIKIGLADAKRNIPTKLQDAVAAVVAGVATGMDQISKMDDSAEIMAEFKTCFDVGKAVSVVQERKRRILAEQEAAEQRKAAQERFKEAEAKVDAVAPPVTVPAAQAAKTEDDPVFESFTFTLYGARKSQLIKIRNYLKQEGINYV